MIQEILTNHEITLENVKHIFYKSGAGTQETQGTDTDTLFISFAGKVDKYVSATWFYNQTKLLGNFLFLKNDEEYNTYNDVKYENLIKHYMTSLNIKHLITYGPSMGGIASIYYGLKFNANTIISIDPNPIDYDYNILLNEIRNYPNHFDFSTKIYLNYTFVNDYNTIPQWTEEIIKELKLKNMILTIQPFRCIEHLSFIPSKEYLLDIIHLYRNLKLSNYTKPGNWF